MGEMGKYIITGTAGFIGYSVAQRLLSEGNSVVGIDNHNDYYDQILKEDRVKLLCDQSKYEHYRIDISDSESLFNVFKSHDASVVINLAAQAGVRYSIENPMAYISSNVVGFANILEACRKFEIEHLVYASSSSVYGSNPNMPFSEAHNTDNSLSLYAASKKSNEVMAHSYSSLYDLPTTGLRFFTVYGPWGRPDMALYKFTDAIINGKPVDVFNFGKHKRDFTYIDDIVEGIIRIVQTPTSNKTDLKGSPSSNSTGQIPHRIYNIGSSNPIDLIEYIRAIEEALGLPAKLNLLPMQPGDVADTFADVSSLRKDFGYSPNTDVKEGISNFIDWYRRYYNTASDCYKRNN